MHRFLFALAVAVAARGAFAENMKIGYVDIQRAVQEVEEGKAARTRLQAELQQKRGDLEKKRADLEKMKADYDKQAPVLSDDAKRQAAAGAAEEVGARPRAYAGDAVFVRGAGKAHRRGTARPGRPHLGCCPPGIGRSFPDRLLLEPPVSQGASGHARRRGDRLRRRRGPRSGLRCAPGLKIGRAHV